MKRDFNAWLATLGAGGAGEDADRAARVEPRAPEGAARSSTARRSSTSPTRWISSADRARYEADRAKDIALAGDARHRRGDEGAQARRACSSPAAAAPAIAARAGYPTVDRAVRAWCRTRRRRRSRTGFDAKPAPFGVELHRHGVQRAAADRAGLRVRAGDEEARAAAVHAVTGEAGRDGQQSGPKNQSAVNE